MKKTDSWHSLFLTLAGAVLSIAGGLGVNFISPERQWLAVLSLSFVGLGFILLYLGLPAPKLIARKIGIGIRDRSKRIRIAILNDFPGPFNPNIYSWSYRPPEAWRRLLYSRWKLRRDEIPLRPKIRLVTTRKRLHRFHAVINPYGGTYPENDYEARKTFEDFVEYARLGGWFVNVADIPTFWAFDKDARRRLPTTPRVYVGEEEVLPFRSTPLLHRLGLTVYWPATGPMTWEIELADRYLGLVPPRELQIVERVAAFEEGVIEPVIRAQPVERRKGQNPEATPFFRTAFGRGYFLISLSRTADSEGNPVNQCLETLIADVLLTELNRPQDEGTPPPADEPDGCPPAEVPV